MALLSGVQDVKLLATIGVMCIVAELVVAIHDLRNTGPVVLALAWVFHVHISSIQLVATAQMVTDTTSILSMSFPLGIVMALTWVRASHLYFFYVKVPSQVGPNALMEDVALEQPHLPKVYESWNNVQWLLIRSFAFSSVYMMT